MSDFFDDYLGLIDNRLRILLNEKKDVYPEALFRAMEYALFSAGKMVRPYLSLLTADFLHIERESVIPLAVSIELIHNYSLIHDDLPCMDNDYVRRGKPSCFAAFGEATALLAGDCLLNLAYEVLFSAVEKNPNLAPSALFISKMAGGEGMIGGQAIELTNDHIDEALVTELCLKKTGALINAAVTSVALLSGEGRKISALGTFAKAIGLEFQLVDDLLDKEKGETKTYLSVFGEERTKIQCDRLLEIAEKSLAPFEGADALLDFARYLNKRKN